MHFRTSDYVGARYWKEEDGNYLMDRTKLEIIL